MSVITQRFFIVIACVIAAIAGGLLLEMLLSFQAGWPFGHTQTGHIVGWAGLAVILMVFVYSAKKRFGRKAGWPKGWFWIHKIAGVLGPVLILIHAGPHFHALIPILTLLTMVIVVISGVIGVAVHRKAVVILKDTRCELLSEGLSKDDVEDRLHDLASGEEAFRVWQIIHTPMVMLFLALVIAHILGALYYGGV